MYSTYVNSTGRYGNTCSEECGDLLHTITFGVPFLAIVYLLILIFGMIKLYSLYEKSEYSSYEPMELLLIVCKYLAVLIVIGLLINSL